MHKILRKLTRPSLNLSIYCTILFISPNIILSTYRLYNQCLTSIYHYFYLSTSSVIFPILRPFHLGSVIL